MNRKNKFIIPNFKHFHFDFEVMPSSKDWGSEKKVLPQIGAWNAYLRQHL